MNDKSYKGLISRILENFRNSKTTPHGMIRYKVEDSVNIPK